MNKAGLDAIAAEELAAQLEIAVEAGVLASFTLSESFDTKPREGEQAIRMVTRALTGEEQGGIPLSEKTVSRFIKFLKRCGGFEIW